MRILHTVNKSPYTHKLVESCLRVCSTGDSILLIEDGVYSATVDSPSAKAFGEKIEQGIKIYALKNDTEARGLQRNMLLKGIELTDYPGFVELSITHQSVQSWY